MNAETISSTATKNGHLLIEPIAEKNLSTLADMMVSLWPDSNYEEELENCKRILRARPEACFVGKYDDEYIGFIQLTLRYDYVEGTSTSPVGYVEGIYVKPDFQRLGFGSRLISKGQEWARNQGCKEFASDAKFSNQDAIDFHDALGFNEINRVVTFAKKLN